MGKCQRLTLKKYKDRPSPPYHAADCPNQLLYGNDNKRYRSVADKRGVYTWKREAGVTRKASHARRYQIHDNGGRPFLVDVDEKKKHLTIYKQKYDFDMEGYLPPKLVKEYAYKQIWIGRDPLKLGYEWEAGWAGNSIVAQIGANRFLSIGWKVQEFSLVDGDEPVLYESYVGNNDVPYPYLIGKTHTYLMIEDVIIPNEWLDLKGDAYAQYYGHVPAPRGSVKPHAKRLRMKLIHGRI